MRSAKRSLRHALVPLVVAAALVAGGMIGVLDPPPAFADPDPDALSPAKTLDRRATQPPEETAPETDPNVVASIGEARRQADAKRFGDAALTLRAVLAINPKNVDARSLLARVLAWDRKYDESIAEYRRILKDNPDDAYNRAGYARVLAWSGQAEESLRQFRRASRSDATDYEALVSYARAYSWAGDLPGASELYRRILRAKPSYGDAWLGLATVARWRGSPTAADRFFTKARAHGADSAGLAEEREAIRRALAPSVAAGVTTAHERQYVEGPDFVIESTGPFAQAAATIARTAGVVVRASRIAQFERSDGLPVGGTTLNYDIDMTVLRADMALLRGYPIQLAAGVERRTLDAGSGNVLFPLLGDDSFFGWNARAWWFAGRWTPSIAVRREIVVLKSTTGAPRVLAGDQTVVAADFGYQWNARGSASLGFEQGSYSDGNERATVRAGAAWRMRLARPGVTIDYAATVTDFDSRSASYFTPLESVRHAGGVSLTGYSEKNAMDYGARYQISDLLSSNFDDIVAHTWSGHLNLRAFGFPAGIEGSYSRDNNAYETWYLGLSARTGW